MTNSQTVIMLVIFGILGLVLGCIVLGIIFLLFPGAMTP